MKLLGVRIDNLAKKEILEKIEFFLSEDAFHQLATVNPEFILTAQQDEAFKGLLNQCSLNVADGIGLKYAFLRFGKILKTRFAGVDLLGEILKIADERKFSVFLAISKDGLSSYDEIKAVLEKKYPSLKIGGGDIKLSHQSSVISHQKREEDDRLPITDYDILFCNFGSPQQERFIYSQKDAKIRLAMGVGGSFDFLTGKIARAPIWMRKIGLEWLWRLMQQPVARARRIFKAVIVFPIKILFSKNQHD
jgi:N-acetylglucosaminyldiphosphoundecaprenol N-acetyl-beta-D-mannosaminyltransferase